MLLNYFNVTFSDKYLSIFYSLPSNGIWQKGQIKCARICTKYTNDLTSWDLSVFFSFQSSKQPIRFHKTSLTSQFCPEQASSRYQETFKDGRQHRGLVN